MPFTFSHPAIVLPLTLLSRRFYSLTGFVIGSMVPDFEYFIRMRIQSNYSHTIGGLFWFDVPLGLLLAFIFHNVVRDSLVDNLPPILSSRLSAFKKFDWNMQFRKKWLVIVMSLLVGSASHLFWDAFTHETGYFVQTISFLAGKVSFLGWQVPVFKLLQHSSTFLGGIAIIAVLLNLPKGLHISPRSKNQYWGAIFLLSIVVVIARFLIISDNLLVGNVIAAGISAFLISVILTSALMKNK